MDNEALKRIAVLIVDDDQTQQQLIEIVLKRIGFNNFVKVDNGYDAKKTYDSSKIDLVISDIKMPGMDGKDLFRRLLESGSNDKNKFLKFMFCTAFSNHEIVTEVKKIIQKTFNDRFKLDYLTKPVQPKTLILKLKDMFTDNPEVLSCLSESLGEKREVEYNLDAAGSEKVNFAPNSPNELIIDADISLAKVPSIIKKIQALLTVKFPFKTAVFNLGKVDQEDEEIIREFVEGLIEVCNDVQKFSCFLGLGKKIVLDLQNKYDNELVYMGNCFKCEILMNCKQSILKESAKKELQKNITSN